MVPPERGAVDLPPPAGAPILPPAGAPILPLGETPIRPVEGGPILPPREGMLKDLPPGPTPGDGLPPRTGWVNVLAPGVAHVRGPLKILLSLCGTPVAMNPLLLDAPIPAKVLPLNLATGSIRNTRWTLTSLK